ncbi:unnamed protein product [Mytilus edulis]|uniref:Uncharacterized protein n=1 Tax=Mytilus edulis TaxID=6550 RepID=A0A8S3SAN0_MYTED|nr:unnamed protein product [Mytilus edulis]
MYVTITPLRGDITIDDVLSILEYVVSNIRHSEVALLLMMSLLYWNMCSITSFRGGVTIDDVTLNTGICSKYYVIQRWYYIFERCQSQWWNIVLLLMMYVIPVLCHLVVLLLMMSLSILVHVASITSFRCDITIDDVTLNTGTCSKYIIQRWYYY